MKIEIDEINGILLSKDIIPIFEIARDHVRGNSSSSFFSDNTPDKKYYGESIVKYAGELMTTHADKILSKISDDTNIRISDIREAGEKITELYNSQKLKRYKCNIKYGMSIEYDYFRIYRSRKNKIIKVSTKSEKSILITNIEDEYEFDVIRIIQWLSNWAEESMAYSIELDKLKRYINNIINYKDLDKLIKINFGDEYSSEDKNKFLAACNDILKELNKYDENKYYSLIMGITPDTKINNQSIIAE